MTPEEENEYNDLWYLSVDSCFSLSLPELLGDRLDCNQASKLKCDYNIVDCFVFVLSLFVQNYRMLNEKKKPLHASFS